MIGAFLTPAEANMRAAYELLVREPAGLFGDYAEHLLRQALYAEPRLQGVLATLSVGIRRGDVTEAVMQLAPLLPPPAVSA